MGMASANFTVKAVKSAIYDTKDSDDRCKKLHEKQTRVG